MLSPEQFCFNAFWWEKLWDDPATAACARSLAEIGYRAVEFKLDSFHPERKMADEFTRAARIAREEGLAVSNFVILRDLAGEKRAQGVRDVLEAIAATAAAGVETLNLPPGAARGQSAAAPEWWRPRQPAWEQAWDNLRASFARLLEAAERAGVYLAVEAVAGALVHDYYSTLELVRHFGSPRLALTLDPSHYFLYRNDIPWAIRQWGQRIRHVHLKDAAGHPGELGADFLFPLLGEGGIEWPAFFQALDDIGYEGYLSVEFEAFKYMNDVLGNDPVRAARLGMESLQALFRRYQETRPR